MGYDPDFLGTPIPAPTPSDAADAAAAAVLDYVHFTVTMHRERRLAWAVAWNVDGTRFFPDIPRQGGFQPDARLPLDEQTTEAVYADNDLDRGHLARRADLLWGTLAEARAANRDSFTFTNITPQHADFNQSGRGGAWGELENAVLDLDELRDRRLTVLAGPVLADDDPPYRDLVQLPREHWKVIAYRLGDELRARAFLLSQDLDHVQGAYLDGFATYEVDVEDLAARTGLDLSGIPAAAVPAMRAEGPRLLETVADIAW